MLIVTDFAAAAIRHLLDGCNAPDDAGLRIARASSAGPLKARLARAPAPEDTVVIAADGARVFLDRAAVNLLGDKILDVSIGVHGRVVFFPADARQPVEPGR
jgi:Fe-S cluster assembly iron-binding protein IscA